MRNTADTADTADMPARALLPPGVDALAGFGIIFDLDGTLVDTAPDLADTLNRVLGMHRLPTIDPREVRPLIGGGARALLARAFHAAGIPCDATRLEAFQHDFLEIYKDCLAEKSRPYPGLRAVLERLARAGAVLGVCSNKREDLTRKILQAFNLDGFFTAITGGGTTQEQKPHPLPLLHTLKQMNTPTARAVFVGDSEIDAETAKRTGTAMIAVRFGYAQIPVDDLPAHARIASYEALIPALLDLKHRGILSEG